MLHVSRPRIRMAENRHSGSALARDPSACGCLQNSRGYKRRVACRASAAKKADASGGYCTEGIPMIPKVARASAGACDWRRGPAAGVCLRTLGGSASHPIAPVLPVLARSRLRSVLVTRCSAVGPSVGWHPGGQPPTLPVGRVMAVSAGCDAPQLSPGVF